MYQNLALVNAKDENVHVEKVIEQINISLHPNSLNQVQEIVLIQSWNGKTYEDIATISGYSIQHIRDVGYVLWQLLSEYIGQKVTKHNVRSVLNKWSKTLYSSQITPVSVNGSLKLPEGPINLNSPLYIKRSPVEEDCYGMMTQPGALIRIKAPRRMGKTSLMMRILNYGKCLNYHTISLNLEQAESSVLQDLDKFLRWFCVNVSRKLGLPAALDDYWDEDIGSKVSCTSYFQGHILQQLDAPIILALDEIDWIFEYPTIAKDFLSLLRFWYEEANRSRSWEKLRLVIAHSTEVYIPLNLNQSPFNVGLPVKLPELNQEQIIHLANLYHLGNLTQEELRLLCEMIGGHPYLVQLTFYHLRKQKITFFSILKNLSTQTGIYSNHLRKHLVTLKAHPELAEAMKKVVSTPESVDLEAILTYKLASMGLLKFAGDKVLPRCKLYRMYFQMQLQH